MPTSNRDAGFLWDMVNAAKTVCAFTQGVRFPDYEKNRMMQLAAEREVEIIGEAARNVSQTFKDAHPEIPWTGIVAQRHVLAHEYGTIRLDKMWLLVTKHIPELVARLEPLIPPPPPEAEA
jgi:uncharacterized protein with HEPN domain